ncbi:MAG: hypothetical protein WBY53_11595 [Acidobacteriaceae bacterium]
MKHEIDIGLISELLRSHGHTVGHVIPTPDNGGEYEFEVDGNLLSLTEVRGLLEVEDEREEAQAHPVTNTAPAVAPAATPGFGVVNPPE